MLEMYTKDEGEAGDNRQVLQLEDSSRNSQEGETEHLPSINLGHILG